MNEAIVIGWLQRNWPIWLAFILAFIPPLIAEMKGRPKTRWYLYGLACALVVWPLVTLPTTHALLLRRRNGMSEQISRKRRRADALALLTEDSVRSYPSWIAELRQKSPAGIDRRRYTYEHLGAGEALELVRERTDSKSDHAVSYYHRAVHLGYVPKQHHWIAEALDDGLRLMVIVESVKPGWIFRRAKFIGTRIIILYDGR
jgi:hypothetical protein